MWLIWKHCAAYADKHEAIGSESCVGMIGATLGGGVGRYNGLHGLLSDSLLSVKIVTAAGKVTTASATENADLFWGLRGAGFNFATVLEASYSVYDETAHLVLNADFLFAPNASLGIMEYFKTFENDLPDRLSFIILATYSSDMRSVGHHICPSSRIQVANSACHCQSAILINAVYAGSQSEGEKYLAPLRSLSPMRQNLTMISWSAINSNSFFGAEPINYTCSTNSPHNVYGGAVHQFDIPTFQNFYEQYDNLTSSIPTDLNGTVYFLEFFPNKQWNAYPRTLPHTRGVISRHTCKIPVAQDND